MSGLSNSVEGPELPHTIEELTPAYLSGLLGQSFPDVRVTALEVVETKVGHTGKARLKLELDPTGRVEGVPTEVCIKGSLSARYGGTRIHILEAQFYAFMRQWAGLPLARHYGSEWRSTPNKQGLVLIEDLIAAGGRFGHSNDQMGVDAVAAGLETLARIHGATWDHPDLPSLDWLPLSMGTRMDDDQVSLFEDFRRRNYERDDYRAFLPDWAYDRRGEFTRAYAALCEIEKTLKPRCLVHGDAHQGNSCVRANGERAWVDWQVARRGSPWRDVSYFIVGSLTIEERRASERELLRQYREHLGAHGAAIPSQDEMWASYRRWAMYGCQSWIGSLDEWGQKAAPMSERFFTALDDLETLKALSVAF